MNAIVKDKNTNEIIATVQTNHSMSIEDVFEVAGLDINEMADVNTPRYDYDALVIEMEQEIADPLFTQWDWTDPSQGTIEG